MTQDELWFANWQEAIDFLETNHRNPSKFIPEERNMRSRWKHNKKLMNAAFARSLPLFAGKIISYLVIPLLDYSKERKLYVYN